MKLHLKTKYIGPNPNHPLNKTEEPLSYKHPQIDFFKVFDHNLLNNEIYNQTLDRPFFKGLACWAAYEELVQKRFDHLTSMLFAGVAPDSIEQIPLGFGRLDARAMDSQVIHELSGQAVTVPLFRVPVRAEAVDDLLEDLSFSFLGGPGDPPLEVSSRVFVEHLRGETDGDYAGGLGNLVG